MVVIGGGGAGLTAAAAAREADTKDSIIMEKAAKSGGKTAQSAGIFAVGSPAQKRKGIDVSVDEIFREKMIYANWRVDPRLVRRCTEKSGKMIRNQGGQAVAMETDIADEALTQAVGDKVMSVYGRVDILLNNAALSYGIEPRPWNEWTVELWDQFFAINTRGTWLVCKAIAPLMEQQKKGKIINLASDVVKLPPSSFLLLYACSKAAIHQITQCLARSLGPSGICVNSIAPGLTATEATLIQPDSDKMFEAPLQCSASSKGKNRRTWWALPCFWPLRNRTLSLGSC
jgi:NAD(P)-dependent dehydrogenase (short-subunit alcohol dehydrogenase family)